MAKFFVYPFGTAGDKTAVPDTGSNPGSVSYQYGWTSYYQLDLNSDPNALPINRQQTNELMYDITSAIQQYQTHGAPDWITSVDNLGSPYSYAIYSRVRYDAGSGVKVWESQTAANTDTPGATSTWYQISGKRIKSVNRVVFDTSGTHTYTPSAGTLFVGYDLMGSGAGGGGCPAATNAAGAGGGGEGGRSVGLTDIATILGGGTQVQVNIGAKGLGGAAGAHDGNPGNTSTIIANNGAGATIAQASGGIAGDQGVDAGASGIKYAASGAGGNGITGDTLIPGEAGGLGLAFGAAQAGNGGFGGNSPYGSGGGATLVNSAGSAPGNNGGGNGSGGSGACVTGSAPQAAGGDGTDGIVVLYEYIG